MVEVSEAVEVFVVGHSVGAAHLVPVGTPRDASKKLQKGRVRHLGDGKKDEPELLHNNGGLVFHAVRGIALFQKGGIAALVAAQQRFPLGGGRGRHRHGRIVLV